MRKNRFLLQIVLLLPCIIICSENHVISGKVKRAPLWMQNVGLEWFFRLMQEPLRMWKRYLIGNTKFLVLVLRSFFRKKN